MNGLSHVLALLHAILVKLSVAWRAPLSIVSHINVVLSLPLTEAWPRGKVGKKVLSSIGSTNHMRELTNSRLEHLCFQQLQWFFSIQHLIIKDFFKNFQSHDPNA